MPRSLTYRCGLLLSWAALFLIATASADDPIPAPAKSLTVPGIENLFQLTERIYSGGQPENEPAYAALKKRGITTILSVDGTPPDVAAAKKYGLRYIHLPIGYDAIPARRQMELAKAVHSVEGKIFVHCHHGKHRGPAAAAILCEESGDWSAAQAREWLKVAGTSPKYQGLWQSIQEFTSPTTAELAAISPDFPARVDPPELVETMIAIDNRFDALAKLARKEAPLTADDLTQQRDHALQLSEVITEWQRTEAFQAKDPKFREQSRQFLTSVNELHQELAKTSVETNQKHITAAVISIEQRCASCHEAFRN